MSILVRKVLELSHQYVRGGSKQNRRLQIGRIIRFVEFIEETEKLNGLQEIGKRHVLLFWKSNRDLAEKTANDYWLAFCILWKLIEKTGTPPKPLFFSNKLTLPINTTTGCEFCCDNNGAVRTLIEVATTLKLIRLSKSLSIENISHETGLDQKTISDIEAGGESCRYVDIATLVNHLKL